MKTAKVALFLNPTKKESYGEMNLDLGKQIELNFCIDYPPRGSTFRWRDHICEKNSSKDLRHLIDHCHGNLTLRSLTDKEREQLQEYKNQQKGKRLRAELLLRKDSF